MFIKKRKSYFLLSFIAFFFVLVVINLSILVVICKVLALTKLILDFFSLLSLFNTSNIDNITIETIKDVININTQFIFNKLI